MYIYEVSCDRDDIGYMDERDFYDKIGELCADYVRNADCPEMERKDFFETMSQYGAITTDAANSIVFPEGFREKYFSRRFEKLKETVEGMTLEQFCGNVYNLQSLIEQECSYYIYADGLYKFDYWLREYMVPGKAYYVGNVVFAH